MNYKEIADKMGPRIGATQEWVFQVLRNGIVSGSLSGGTQLKQDEISAALNVSHIPVREALRRLEAQGLVTIHPNRGASVTQLSRESLIDMMEVRATLSVMLLKNGAPLFTQEDYCVLEHIIEEQKMTEDLFASENLNYQFHGRLSSHADNSFANLLMELVHANIDRYVRAGFYQTPETRGISIGQHEQIVAACRKGDYEKACDLLRDHILFARELIPANIK
ncbi:MAG: GntR family transcriptional regulator [Clostridia bacterium]